jgi:Ca2+:H+ antiporter
MRNRSLKNRLGYIFNVGDIQTLLGFCVLMFTISLARLSLGVVLLCSLFLALGISSSVHYAAVIAKRIGPSLGTLVLALSVTVIEVALIVSLMSTNPNTAGGIARDTVFAAIMIGTNGIAGISILLGGFRHKELGFQPLGTSSLMAALVSLSMITMVLPNYTSSTLGPTYNNSQLIFVSIASLIIYILLVWAQTKSHKNYFEPLSPATYKKLLESQFIPSRSKAIWSFFGLLISLGVVVGLAKVLSPSLGTLVNHLGAPPSVVGILMALLVLAPETFASLKAAKANQLQTSLNLALGSGAASVALTIPTVSAYSIFTEQPLLLGLDQKSTVFLALTFIAGNYTFGSGRTTTLHGAVHLIILMSYLVMSFIP